MVVYSNIIIIFVLSIRQNKYKSNEIMEMFKVGQTYRGESGVGQIDLTIVKRTEKSVVVKTVFGENRCMIKKYSNAEAINFKSWYSTALDVYSKEQQEEDSFYQAYYS